MLLHGERENAGLNIVCASRVFLLESVVNHAFEVQGTWVGGLGLFFVIEELFQPLPESIACPKHGRPKVSPLSLPPSDVSFTHFLSLVFCYYAKGRTHLPG